MKVTVFNGEKLTSLRKEKNLSQSCLAEKAGLQKSTISHWESDMVKRPNKKNVKKICEILGVSEEEMYMEAEAEEEEPQKKKVFDGGMLRFLRESQGYSQKELAVKMGLKGGDITISKMERGVIGCKRTNIKKLADFFGVDEQDFYREES